MIRMSVLYPKGEGVTFDVDYYRTAHMAIVHRTMGGVVRSEVDQPIDGPYAGVGHLYFESMESLQATMGNGSTEALDDIPNFTNSQPVIQISQVLD